MLSEKQKKRKIKRILKELGQPFNKQEVDRLYREVEEEIAQAPTIDLDTLDPKKDLEGPLVVMCDWVKEEFNLQEIKKIGANLHKATSFVLMLNKSALKYVKCPYTIKMDSKEMESKFGPLYKNAIEIVGGEE